MEHLLEQSEHVDAVLLSELAASAAVAAGRDKRPVISPFDESTIGEVPEATPEDVAAAFDVARVAQEEWARTPLRDRLRIFTRFHDLVLDNADTAMDIIQIEAGKSRIPAFEEVYDVPATVRYYINTAQSALKRRRRASSLPGFTRTYEYRRPHGVVGGITPWNFPFTLAVSDFVPAFIAGNAVVLKPDEKTPFSVLFARSLLVEAGLPPDVWQIVTGHGEAIGQTVVDNADYVVFTGSTEVGRLVGENAGRRLVATTMELGGKNAAVVLADADLDKSIPGIARAVYANGGQLCIAAERIYVDEAIRDEFTTRFVEYSRNQQLSPTLDYSADLSSMIDRPHFDKVQYHVEDAVAKGATILTGGKPRPDVGPLFFEPTVLTDVDESMALCRGETFGPVVTLYGFSNVDDAIEMANDSEFGLNYSVWTSDRREGEAIAGRLEAGTVGINDGYAATWSSYDAPMGGMKASGLGRRHGREGILKFTEAQTIASQRGVPAFAPVGSMGYERYQRVLGPVLKLLRRLPFYK